MLGLVAHPSTILRSVLVVPALGLFVTAAVEARENARAPGVHSSPPARVTPPREEPRPVRVVEPKPARGASADKVNINAADVGTLMTLPGISRALAQRIVAYREAHGPFTRASDVRKVDGVGAAVWEKSRARIVIK